jgi:hypothetical protein
MHIKQYDVRQHLGDHGDRLTDRTGLTDHIDQLA